MLREHDLILANDEERLRESNNADKENDQKVEHVIHDDEDGFYKWCNLGYQSHVVHALEPHAQDQHGFNDSDKLRSKADVDVDESHKVGHDDQEVNNAPNSNEDLNS